MHFRRANTIKDDYSDIGKACHSAKKAIYNAIVGKVLFYEVVEDKEYPWIKCE